MAHTGPERLALPTSQRRTRIVATLGPATDPPEILRAALRAGIDVARINFSHGSPDEHLERVDRLREAAREVGKEVAILADLPGPKLRVKMAGPRSLAAGERIRFALEAKPADAEMLAITEPEMLADIRAGQRILLDDGRIQLEAAEHDGQQLWAVVKVAGTLLPNKGINLPDTPLSIAALTERDRQALKVAAQAGADWLALSFVRSAAAADELRAEARLHGLDIPVLAKMERPEAVEHMTAICEAFDAIMVARGDLGVEIPLQCVPTVQKRLISVARALGKPVITATDMLDSMRQNPRPTRAEAGDVANAIYDGTDAVMLSGETAVGAYPVESITCMAEIALEAERNLEELGHPGVAELRLAGSNIADHVTQAICELAERIGAEAIITPTLSGRTARLLARHRPRPAVIAPAPSLAVVRQMAVSWGLQPVLMDDSRRKGDDRIDAAVRSAFAAGGVAVGALAVIFAGHPIEGGLGLPTIRVIRVGPGGTQLEP